MKLKIAVKARPNTPIDHTKVKIQVFFYDTVDNKEVVLTDADVSYEWLTPHHDWKDDQPGSSGGDLSAGQEQTAFTRRGLVGRGGGGYAARRRRRRAPPKKEPSAELPGEGGDRKYLGYIVRIYYNDQLQAVRADPTKLLNLFPPPFTAPQ